MKETSVQRSIRITSEKQQHVFGSINKEIEEAKDVISSGIASHDELRLAVDSLISSAKKIMNGSFNCNGRAIRIINGRRI